jgi:hypothetical protein
MNNVITEQKFVYKVYLNIDCEYDDREYPTAVGAKSRISRQRKRAKCWVDIATTRGWKDDSYIHIAERWNSAVIHKIQISFTIHEVINY